MDIRQLHTLHPLVEERVAEELVAAATRHGQRLPGRTADLSMLAPPQDAPVMTRPYTKAEVQAMAKQTGGFIAGVMTVDLADVIGRREDEFYGLLGEKLIGVAEALNDITWRVIGARNGLLLLLVAADASGWLVEIAPAVWPQQRRRWG